MITEGTHLDSRYRVTTLLATGGMGEVWRGQDDELDMEVAIKVLKQEAATNVTFLKRFEIEARNAAGLQHKNIAQVLDYGTHDGSAYMIMELVEGQSLASILERDKVLDEHTLVSIMKHTAQGLEAAHEAGVIHRDIKPGNLLVQADGLVKITDFGVSRTEDQTTLTQTGMVMGTAQYLAPELALGKPATAQSDLYALGIIAWESLVGKRPFVAPNPVDIAIAQVNDPVPPLPSTVAPALSALVFDLLEKNPRKRPGNAAELHKRLANLHLPSAKERKLRDAPLPQSIAPRHRGGAPQRPMPPTIAPKAKRARPDTGQGAPHDE
jgi:eukaryotic-like serine/threonine-protein kinase